MTEENKLSIFRLTILEDANGDRIEERETIAGERVPRYRVSGVMAGTLGPVRGERPWSVEFDASSPEAAFVQARELGAVSGKECAEKLEYYLKKKVEELQAEQKRIQVAASVPAAFDPRLVQP